MNDWNILIEKRWNGTLEGEELRVYEERLERDAGFAELVLQRHLEKALEVGHLNSLYEWVRQAAAQEESLKKEDNIIILEGRQKPRTHLRAAGAQEKEEEE